MPAHQSQCMQCRQTRITRCNSIRTLACKDFHYGVNLHYKHRFMKPQASHCMNTSSQISVKKDVNYTCDCEYVIYQQWATSNWRPWMCSSCSSTMGQWCVARLADYPMDKIKISGRWVHEFHLWIRTTHTSTALLGHFTTLPIYSTLARPVISDIGGRIHSHITMQFLGFLIIT